MAAKGFNIGIGAETKAFKQGVEAGLIDPLEDAADKLDELGKSKGTDRLESGMKDAQKATEKLDKEVKSTADAIEREFRDAYRDLKRSSEDGTDAAVEGMDDLRQEAGQSARETAASFSGSFDDIGSMAQEVAANAFAGFGPAGAAAGVAAAAGLGLVFAEMEAQKEQAEQLKARLSGLYQGALESGREYIDQAQFIAESNDLRFNPDRANEWKQLQEDANKLGLTENEIIKANSGDLEALAVVQARVRDLVKETYGDETNIDMLRLQTQELGGIEERWIAVNEVALENQENLRGAAEAASQFWKEAIAGAESAEVAVDDFGNQLVKLDDGREIVIEADTGRASDDISKFKAGTDEVIEQLSGKDVLLRVKVDESAWLAWQRKPRQFDAKVNVGPGKEWF
ncbi:MAG: hypothetical protein GX868_03175 [Actinobacteria bacterium]|nr:hypothetical protein [Actinomycetota bacterium]